MTKTFGRREALRLGTAAATVGLGAAAGATVPLLGAPAAASSTVPAYETTEAGVQAYCVNPATLARHTAVGGAVCMAEGGGAATILINEGFFQQLYDWRMFWQANVPYSWSTQLWNFGAYSARDGSCTSWHEAGRAFDITSLRDDVTTMHFWCRYDLWKSLSNAAAHRRKYWAGAASLHYHFRSVLTYFYNSDHHNHIHVDNGESGSSLSTFSTGSKAQVQAVQGVCANIWGYPCGSDGVWDSAVNTNSARVLSRIGVGGYLTSGQAYWQAFLRASVRHATGKQTY